MGLTIPTATQLIYGDMGDVVSDKINDQMILDDRVHQFIMDCVSNSLDSLFGNGILAGSYTPPIVSIGAGLSVDIASHFTVNGFVYDSPTVVAFPIPVSDTYYIWEEVIFDADLNTIVISYDLTPTNVNPGGAILIGTATTNLVAVTAVTDEFTLVNSVGRLMPTGAILLWSGSIVSIPGGWQLCDGTNSTPDLRDKFIVGAGMGHSVADTGGSASHLHANDTLAANNTTIAEHAAHTHALSSGSTYTVDPGAAHGLDDAITVNSVGLSTGATLHSPHGHSITGNTASTTTLPPYYALAYIMKTL